MWCLYDDDRIRTRGRKMFYSVTTLLLSKTAAAYWVYVKKNKI